MPKFVTVPVVKAFSYEGVEYAPGSTVEMTPVHASIHSRKGNISLSMPMKTLLKTRELEAEETPATTRRARRTYRRRDMTAEDQ